jgi:ribosomal protein S12 methylthiotransferase accessory factor
MSIRDPRLRLDGRFTHLVEADQSVVLVSDDDAILLEAAPARDVVPLLDGRRTAIEIARELEELHRPEIVHFVLLSLEKHGVVREEPEGETVSERTVDSRAHPDLEDSLAARLRSVWLRRGTSNVERVLLRRPDGSLLDLLLTDDYLHSELAEHQDHSARADPPHPLLLARLGSRKIWIGPCIVPGETACVSCLQERLRLNLSARALVHLQAGETPDSLVVQRVPTEIPPTAYRLLAEHLEDHLHAERLQPELALLRVVPLEDGSPESHRVSRLPHCPACGDPALAPPGADLELRSRPRRGRSGSGYRILDPEETLDRFSPLISPLTGVVRHVRKVPVEGTELVHVYTASHSHHYAATSVRAVKDDRRDHSGGKGMTDVEARVSALCESLERFSSVHRGSEPVQIARLSELGARALHPNELMLFSQEQFRTREEWNARQSGGFQRVPEPYEDEPIEWSEMRSLVTGESRLVPSSCVYFGFKGEGKRFCKADSNGLAGGNCLEEAILQGYLELVERDAIALWWYNQARVAGVELESFEDRWVDRLLEYYPSIGRRLWALDLTTDLRIPCFTALSALEGPQRADIIFGFGAHPDPSIALRRALTEVNQMLPTVLRTPEERRRQLLPEFEDAIQWWESATLDGHPYLLPDESKADWSLANSPPPAVGDLRDDVLDCVARAEAVGLDVLVHDLTRPDVSFAVARVVAPGLRHFWRRLGPGRLYDVPVRLGWVDAPRSEAAMNPVSMFV